MPKAKTSKKFISDAIAKYGDAYDYSKIKYVNSSQKLDIRCVKHDYVFQQTGRSHLFSPAIPCRKCREEKRQEKREQEFCEELEEKYPNLKVTDMIHGFTGKKAEITILFEDCGHTVSYATGPQYVLNRGDECPICHPNKATAAQWGESTLVKRWEKLKTRLEEKYDGAFGYDEVVFTGNKNDESKIFCKKHRLSFSQALVYHEKTGTDSFGGCPECKKESLEAKWLERERDTFNKLMARLPTLKVLTDFLGWDKYLKIECITCGEIIEFNKEDEGVNRSSRCHRGTIYERLWNASSPAGSAKGTETCCPNCSVQSPYKDWEIAHLNKPIPVKELHEKYLPHRSLKALSTKRLAPRYRERDLKHRAEIKEKETKSLNEFYRIHDVPRPLWTREEFGTEKELQEAIAHIISNKYNLDVVLEKQLCKEARIDIFVTELELNIEVKLDSSVFLKYQVEKIGEQVSKYKPHNETVVVSLYGEPEGWDSDCPWLDPKELFDFILEKCESNLTPN